MSENTLNSFDRTILRLIIEAPGSSGNQLFESVLAKVAGGSKIRKALSWLIGPYTGELYISLAKLENFDLVKSEWGEATKERGWHRPRLYSPARVVNANVSAAESLDNRLAVLIREAADLGYILVCEPKHPDSPHAIEDDLRTRAKAIEDFALQHLANAVAAISRGWPAQEYEAVRDACERMRGLLTCALDEHDLNHGKFAPDYLPAHWTHQARAALNVHDRPLSHPNQTEPT